MLSCQRDALLPFESSLHLPEVQLPEPISVLEDGRDNVFVKAARHISVELVVLTQVLDLALIFVVRVLPLQVLAVVRDKVSLSEPDIILGEFFIDELVNFSNIVEVDTA